MRVPYKSYPLNPPNKLGEKFIWWPVLPIRLVDKRVQVKTKSFHAVVDSGSSMCLFHADFLSPFRVRLEDGIEDEIGGVGKGGRVKIYYHDVWILIGADWRIGVKAGFSSDLSCAGILGRLGFFTSFKVLFDHSNEPPCCEITQIQHSVVH